MIIRETFICEYCEKEYDDEEAADACERKCRMKEHIHNIHFWGEKGEPLKTDDATFDSIYYCRCDTEEAAVFIHELWREDGYDSPYGRWGSIEVDDLLAGYHYNSDIDRWENINEQFQKYTEMMEVIDHDNEYLPF